MKEKALSDVPPYAIVAGNPARLIRRRFDDELIALLLRFRWWDRPVEEINELIPLLTCGDLERVRRELRQRLYTPLSLKQPFCGHLFRSGRVKPP